MRFLVIFPQRAILVRKAARAARNVPWETAPLLVLSRGIPVLPLRGERGSNERRIGSAFIGPGGAIPNGKQITVIQALWATI